MSLTCDLMHGSRGDLAAWCWWAELRLWADVECEGVAGLSLPRDCPMMSLPRQLGLRAFSPTHLLPAAAREACRDLVVLKVTQLGKPQVGVQIAV